jgi:hypothetical protein
MIIFNIPIILFYNRLKPERSERSDLKNSFSTFKTSRSREYVESLRFFIIWFLSINILSLDLLPFFLFICQVVHLFFYHRWYRYQWFAIHERGRFSCAWWRRWKSVECTCIVLHSHITIVHSRWIKEIVLHIENNCKMPNSGSFFTQIVENGQYTWWNEQAH